MKMIGLNTEVKEPEGVVGGRAERALKLRKYLSVT